MPAISFTAKPSVLDSWTILRLPKDASAKLPSRGLVMVKGTINGFDFATALEPDGVGSHWFRVDDSLRQAAGISDADSVKLAIEPSHTWPEPTVPTDIAKALAADAKANTQWAATTPMARWEWIRWIRATNRPETRQRHIEVACSKLRAGARRPCCFNSSMCTEPSVSKNGVLLEA